MSRRCFWVPMRPEVWARTAWRPIDSPVWPSPIPRGSLALAVTRYLTTIKHNPR